MPADDSHEDEKEKIRETGGREGGTRRSDGLRSMQFSRGSIKALGAISGCLNKAIVARLAFRPSVLSLAHLLSPSLSRLAILLANLICLFPSARLRNVKGVAASRSRLEGYRPQAASGFIKSIECRGGG